jgi:phosphatidate cytidylyltransferase
MQENLSKRIITSIVLLSLFLFINFSHEYIFFISILMLGIIVCIECNNIFLKFFDSNLSKDINNIKNFNPKFLILNSITFCYIFLIFCNFSYQIYKSEGPFFFLFLISVCFFTDIGGYVCGKIIGGIKLTKISPNKTLSGTIGSFIFSLIPLFIFHNSNYLILEFNLGSIMFCLLISLISQLGDLFVSYLKRKAKIKDTGKLLPGHGGALDRVDGIIFAIPYSFFLLKLF